MVWHHDDSNEGQRLAVSFESASQVRGKDIDYRAVIVATYFTRVVAIALLCSISCAATLGAASAPKMGAWSKTQLIDPGVRSSVSVVSCATTTFCAAVDTNGDVHVWRSGTWLAPQHLNAGGSLSSISCPTTTFCVAIGSEAMAYNGRTWRAIGSPGPRDSYQISCVTSTFCVATGVSGLPGKPSVLAVFNGHSWSSQRTVSTGKLSDRVLDVSCASVTYCVAVNLNGKILTYDGSRWTTLPKAGPAGLISVSCATVSFCLAISDQGSSIVIHGHTWAAERDIGSLSAAFAFSVSCATTKECFALGLNGHSATWRDGDWSKARTVFADGFFSGVSVSCVAQQQCLAVDSKDQSSLYRRS